jgi:nitroimidazol reductase NimA-like FMN-containing flavoprotein (pyridoxamine 5'-phosphate oxidase superfamily)
VVFEEMDSDECFRALATKSIGRLVVLEADEPDLFPVNYLLDGTRIVFRTAWGLKLMQSVLQRVAFEVDEIDEDRHEAWSVVIRGVAEEITDELADRSQSARDELLKPWGPGAKDHWVRIVPRVVTGRRLVHRSSAPNDR